MIKYFIGKTLYSLNIKVQEIDNPIIFEVSYNNETAFTSFNFLKFADN